MTFKGTVFLLAMLSGTIGFAQDSAASAFMATDGRTTQPVGHYEFCQREPEECRQRTSDRQPVELTRALWSEIVAINDDVNTSVVPVTDMEMWGREELWSYPTAMGDCEDYALEKRRRLMALGLSAGDVLMTVVRQPNGDGHAVLTVRTSRGDFVLDNLEARVLIWSDTNYTFLKRQSERHSGTWLSIDNGRSAVAVGSVR